jgi:hypothetical protein
MTALTEWEELRRFVNARAGTTGCPGVRDPAYPCEAFDGRGYNGRGSCLSDGHYLCVDCSELSPEAPRFTQSRDGRRDRLQLFWARSA